MAKKKSVFHESKDAFVNRKKNSNIRKTMHEHPLLAAKREDSVGNTTFL